MTDAGEAFIKGMGNPAGNDALASELVAAELACWFGLVVPDFAIVEISDLEIEMEGAGPMMQGPAFASRSVEGAVADGTEGFLKALKNPGHVSRLVLFDTWIRNADRCPPQEALDPEPRRDNLFFRLVGQGYELMAIDHTHSFVEGSLEDDLDVHHLVSDDRLYGLFPEFRPFIKEADVRASADQLRLIDARSVDEIVDAVPAAWGPSLPVRRRWAEMIVERGRRVAQIVPERLVAQGAFGL